MAKFLVTIQQVVTTEVIIEANSAVHARRIVKEYGPAEAAVDFAEQDTKTDRIKSVAPAPEWA